MPHLRILEIAEASLAGTGRHVLDLTEGLTVAGHEIHLVYGKKRTDQAFAARLRTGGLAKAIQVPLSLRRGPHPADIIPLLRLWRYMRRHGPFDVIHGHSSKGGLLARLLGALTHTPCVYTAHAFITLDPTMGFWKRQLFMKAERLLAMLTDAFVILSNAEHIHAQELHLPPHRLHRIANGITPSPTLPRAEARSALGLPEDGVVLGFVGRMVWQKGPDRLVPLLAKLHRHGLKARLCAIGSGPHFQRCIQAATIAGLSSSTVWAGERDAPRLIKAFDMLVVPSRYEALPYIFLEAVHAGIPVAAMAVGGTGAGEIIRNGETGIVVAEGDVDSLVDGLYDILTSPARHAALVKGCGLAAPAYTAHTMVDRMENLYRSLAPARSFSEAPSEHGTAEADTGTQASATVIKS